MENIRLRKKLDSIKLKSLIKNSDTEIQESQIKFLKEKLQEIHLKN